LVYNLIAVTLGLIVQQQACRAVATESEIENKNKLEYYVTNTHSITNG